MRIVIERRAHDDDLANALKEAYRIALANEKNGGGPRKGPNTAAGGVYTTLPAEPPPRRRRSGGEATSATADGMANVAAMCAKRSCLYLVDSKARDCAPYAARSEQRDPVSYLWASIERELSQATARGRSGSSRPHNPASRQVVASKPVDDGASHAMSVMAEWADAASGTK